MKRQFQDQDGLGGRKIAMIALMAAVGAFVLQGVAEASDHKGKGRDKTDAIAFSLEDFTECLGGSGNVPPGSIEVGLDHAQCFTYVYAGPNVAALRGAYGLDEITSDFDLSPEGEAENDGGDCDTDGCGGCDDGNCDGVKVIIGSCEVYPSQPDSSVKINDGAIPPKQPEILVYDLADSGNTRCGVRHWVKTVGNPGHVTMDADKNPQCTYPIGDGNGIGPGETGDCDPDNPNPQIVLFDVYEPAGCTPLREFTRDPNNPLDGIIVSTGGDQLPINDYVRVNEGPKGFDDEGVLFDSSDFIIDLQSIQLKPIGCDTDGDGVADEVDADPLDPAVS